MAFVSWKDRKRAMPGLKAIYRAESAAAAAAQLDAFEAIALSGGRPGLAARLGTRGADVRVPAGDPTLESLHRSLRKIIKTRGASPATKLRPSCSIRSGTPGCVEPAD